MSLLSNQKKIPNFEIIPIEKKVQKLNINCFKGWLMIDIVNCVN